MVLGEKKTSTLLKPTQAEENTGATRLCRGAKKNNTHQLNW